MVSFFGKFQSTSFRVLLENLKEKDGDRKESTESHQRPFNSESRLTKLQAHRHTRGVGAQLATVASLNSQLRTHQVVDKT